MRRFSLVIAAALLVVLAWSATGLAQEANALTKFGRGLVNMGSCWLEVPKQAYEVTKEDGPLAGITYGIVKGTAMGIARGASGVYDTATFPIPKYDQKLMEPEYVFEGW
jgi:putative exosortase-associated protein (TIGR04073 family)